METATVSSTEAPPPANEEQPVDPLLLEGLKLCQEDEELDAAMGAVIGSRRIYWIARNLVAKRIQEHKASEDVLITLLKYGVSYGDTFEDPYEMIKDTAYRVEAQIRTLVANEAARVAEEIRKLDALEDRAEQEVRAAKPIPVGWGEGEEVYRNRTCVFYGDPVPVGKKIASAFDNIVAFNQNEPDEYCNVLRLCDFGTQQLQSKSNKRTELKVFADAYKGCANSHGSFEKFMTNWVRMLNKKRVDVLIIDNLFSTNSENFAGRSPVATAHSAHRIIRKWADAHGCAVIAGIPNYDNEDYSSDIDRLSSFVNLRVCGE